MLSFWFGKILNLHSLESRIERKGLVPNNEETKIIDEVVAYIKKKYGKYATIKFEVFEPLTPEWKSKFKHPLGGYAWGDNWTNFHINLTRCKDKKAFSELVFHEIYENIVHAGHEIVVPEERRYIEEELKVKLDKWEPLQDEMIRTLYYVDKKMLEDSFKNCGEQSKTPQEINQRAKELGFF